MEDEEELSRGTFMQMAEAYGLDIHDPHIDDLYAYVQSVLPGLKAIDELDLTDVEPATVYIPPKEQG